MTKETKEDVFCEMAVENFVEHKNMWYRRYKAALPDDLPRIPKSIDSIIRQSKVAGWNLYKLMGEVTDRQQFAADRGGHDTGADWIAEHADNFARAWILEAWQIEETGEILKLEAEK